MIYSQLIGLFRWQKNVNKMFLNIAVLYSAIWSCSFIAAASTSDRCSPSQADQESPSASQCADESQQKTVESFVTRYAECPLSPECGEGPYFIEEDILRNNLVEDRIGHPLRLKVNVIDYRTCSPVADAKLHIWQPDFAGIYSGFMSKPPIRRERMTPKDQRRFLRGTQITDGNGTVTFETLFPGHYPGRTPHIHFRVHLNESVAHIGQIFFTEQIIGFINARPPYNQVTSPRIRNEDDGEFSYFGGEKSIIELKPAEKLEGVMNVVIDPFHKSRLTWA